MFAALLLAGGKRAHAHNGPPFPIVENRRVGPVIVSVWTNPDVGTGSFFVMVDPPPGGAIPADLKVDIAVQPLTGRLPEKTYHAWRENLHGQVEYKALVPFDAQEMWRVRVTLTSAQGGGETTANVMVTPPGLGAWDMLLYLLPFLGAGFLWFKAARDAQAAAKTCRDEGRMIERSLSSQSSCPAYRTRCAAVLLAIVLTACTGCRRGLPKPPSKAYTDYVSAFYVGLAALQVGDDVRAEKQLALTTQMVAAEPAGWANWGILRLRQRDFDAASERLNKARNPPAKWPHLLLARINGDRKRAIGGSHCRPSQGSRARSERPDRYLSARRRD